MGNRDLPMMPLFPQDFFGATSTWKFNEKGAYILMLMHEWILDELPNDVERLSNMVGLTFHEFEKVWPVVSQKFQENENGALVNLRLGEHRQRAIELTEAKKLGASKTNEKRWSNHIAKRRKNGRVVGPLLAKRLAERDARRLAQRIDSASHLSPSLSPSSIQDKSLGVRERTQRTRTKVEESPEFLDFKLTYPARSGDYRWKQTMNAINTRLKEGHAWEEIMAGVRRYAAYCEAKGDTGTQFVMQPIRFVGPDKPFQLPWPAPAVKATPKHQSFDEWHAEAQRRAERENGAPS